MKYEKWYYQLYCKYCINDEMSVESEGRGQNKMNGQTLNLPFIISKVSNN